MSEDEPKLGLKGKLQKLGRNSEFIDREKMILAGLAGISLLITITAMHPFESDLVGENGQETPEIEGEVVDVTVNDARASPNRPTISEEDGIRFVNQASHDLNFTFDREVESFVLEEGESKTVDVNSIVYYYVNPAEDVEFREIKGSVNVQ